MVDRYLLRYFLAVIDQGTFSKAARHLNVAQPTLSVGIGKLERLLGTSLFHRSSQRVHLTDAGTRLAVHARRIENEFNLAEAAVLDMKPRNALRLGVISTFPNPMLAALVSSAQQDALAERLELFGGNERDLLQRLSRGQIDAALTIIRPENERFSSETLFTEGYGIAMHSGHPLAQREALRAEELADNPMIVRRHCEALTETSRHFTERGVRPFFAFRGVNDDQILALVHAGLGLTVMPMSYTGSGIARPTLSGFELQRSIGIVYAPHAESVQHGASPILAALRARYL